MPDDAPVMRAEQTFGHELRYVNLGDQREEGRKSLHASNAALTGRVLVGSLNAGALRLHRMPCRFGTGAPVSLPLKRSRVRPGDALFVKLTASSGPLNPIRRSK